MDKGNFKLKAEIDTKPIQDVKGELNTIQAQVSGLESRSQKLKVLKERFEESLLELYDHVVKDFIPTKDKLLAEARYLKITIAGLDEALAETETKAKMIAGLRQGLRLIDNEIAASLQKVNDLESKAMKLQSRLVASEKQIKVSGTQAWHVLNSLMHSVDAVLDRQVDGYTQLFGTVFSIMLNVVNAINAAGTAIAASGPVGAFQAAAIFAASGVSTNYQIQGLVNTQALKSQRTYLGELEASNAPW